MWPRVQLYLLYAVCTIGVLALMAVGAAAAWAATRFVDPWLGVLVVAVIGFGSAPDFEIGVVAAVMTLFACAATTGARPEFMILLPGAVVGLLIAFRLDTVREWLYPPPGTTPPTDDRKQG